MLQNHLRPAIRGLRRDPTLVWMATLTLAVSIGANTTVFSLVNSILIRSLPYPAAARVYWIREQMGGIGSDPREVGLGSDYYSLREANRVFDDVAAYDTLTVNWSGAEQPEQLDAAQVTPSFFRVMGSAPMLGRYLAPEEQGRKAAQVVVVSYPFWRNRLGSDPAAVGKTIVLDRMAWTILGVMPQGFDYPRGTQLWRPIPMDEASERPRSVTRPMRLVNMLARLKPGMSPTELFTELDRLAYHIRREYPKEFESAGFLNGMRIVARPLQRQITGDVRPALVMLSGAVGLVLLIACANLANLLLARAAGRQRDMAVRMALGSGRGGIVKQVLAESVALALPGGVAGAALACLAVETLNAWKPLVLDKYPPVSLDVPTLAFTCALTLLTALLFGMAPALAAAGVSIQEALKSAGPAQSGGRTAKRVRQLLVVAELSLSLVLMIGAALLTRSFLKLSRVELGFRAENLLTLRVNLTGPRYATAQGQAAFYEDVLARIQRLPNVRSAAVSTDLPLGGDLTYSAAEAFQIAGRTPVPLAQRPDANLTVVSPEFFRTLGIPLASGRTFSVEDKTRTDTVVVNEAFAKRIFPGEDPLGHRILFGENDRSGWTIVGVVGNIRGVQLGAEPAPLMYRCNCRGDNEFLTRMGLIVRTTGDPRAAARNVESQVYAVDRNEPVTDVKTMQQRIEDSLSPQRFELILLGTFAALAIILASLGIYGVLSYLVVRRTREIGIRMTLGARPGQIVHLVLSEGLALIGAAVIVGLGGAWGLTRYLRSMLYGVAPLDAASFAAMPLLLAVIALAACFAPARKASRTDPSLALRDE